MAAKSRCGFEIPAPNGLFTIRRAIAMFGPSTTNSHPKQRRSPRFPFDSLVRVTVLRLIEETRLWGRSTDLCREGIGVTVAGELTPEELVAMQIPLPRAKPVTLRASVLLLRPQSIQEYVHPRLLAHQGLDKVGCTQGAIFSYGIRSARPCRQSLP